MRRKRSRRQGMDRRTGMSGKRSEEEARLFPQLKACVFCVFSIQYTLDTVLHSMSRHHAPQLIHHSVHKVLTVYTIVGRSSYILLDVRWNSFRHQEWCSRGYLSIRGVDHRCMQKQYIGIQMLDSSCLQQTCRRLTGQSTKGPVSVLSVSWSASNTCLPGHDVRK